MAPTININTVHAAAVVRDYISQPRISKRVIIDYSKSIIYYMFS